MAERPSKIIERAETVLSVSQERLLPGRDGIMVYGARNAKLDDPIAFSADADGCLAVRGCVEARQAPGESYDVELVGPRADSILARLCNIEKQLTLLTASLSSLPQLLTLQADQLREIASLKLNAETAIGAATDST